MLKQINFPWSLQMSCMPDLYVKLTYFFVFVITVKLIFSVNDAHLSPRSVLLGVLLHPFLSGDTTVCLIKSKLTTVALETRRVWRLSHSFLASASRRFLYQRPCKNESSQGLMGTSSRRHFEITEEEKLGEMLRCAARRLVPPSLRGSSPMLGMFWLPFSDILG